MGGSPEYRDNLIKPDAPKGQISPRVTALPQAFQQHERQWRQNLFVYPVVSRRSGGLSIGINLNPDKACNFDCVYCQVDRTVRPLVRRVDLDVLRKELDTLLTWAIDGSLFTESPFDCLTDDHRGIRDIAFSGDGEPTASPVFREAVVIAAEARQQKALGHTKLVLITDACYLTKRKVREALQVLDANHDEIWAKLDAGTEPYFKRVNRGKVSLDHVLRNILEAARARPIVIQSMWMKLHGQSPPPEEIAAFATRLQEITRAGGRLKLIQLYTVARRTTEAYAEPVTMAELQTIAEVVRQQISVPVEVFPGREV